MSVATMPVELANNWLALEPHMVALLQRAVFGMTPAVHVLTRADLAAVKESAQHTPAVHIVYGRTRVMEVVGTRMRLRHTWYAVAAVRNAAGTQSGQAARADAGPLVERMVNALFGAALPGATTTLEPADAPPPLFSAGFLYMPTAFEVETVFHKH